MWLSGASETVTAEWLDADTLTDPGVTSAVVRYIRYNGATREYLQTDLTTFSASDFSFALTQSGTEWSKTITIPAEAKGYNLYWEASPTPSDLGVIGGEHFIGPINDVTGIDWTTTADASTSPVATSHRHLTGTLATDYLTIAQYKRDPSEGFITIGTPSYVRGATGGNNFRINGAKEAGKDVTVTWRGTNYTIAGNASNFAGTTLGGSTWEFNGDPGNETGAGTTVFQIASAGSITKTANINIDRTAPTITTWAVASTNGVSGGVPIYRGEHVTFTVSVSDAGSGVTTRVVSESSGVGSTLASLPTVGSNSMTTTAVRTANQAALNAVITRTLVLTVTDLAGNSNTANASLFFTTLPTAQTFSATSVTSSNEIPNTLYSVNLGETSYNDASVSTSATVSSAFVRCRNTNTDNTNMALSSGTLTLTTNNVGTLNGLTTVANTAAVPAQTSNTSSTGKNVILTLTDQYYRTLAATAFGSFNYNAQKVNDLSTDYTAISFADLGLNNSGAETFFDAVVAPRTGGTVDGRVAINKVTNGGIITTTGTVGFWDGFARPGTNGCTVAVKIPIPVNNSANTQYAIRVQGASGTLVEADGITVASSPTGAATWTTRTTGVTFTGPTAPITYLDVRLTWTSSSGPAVEAIFVGYVE